MQRLFDRSLPGRRKGSSASSLVELINGEDWKLVTMECKMEPQAASVWSDAVGFFDGCYDTLVLPLHRACALRPPLDVVKTLIDTYSYGVSAKEKFFDRLPIHISIQNEASLEVIDLLLARYPEGAMSKDALGRLPLHYAMSHKAPAEVVKSILAAFPASAGVEDKNGWIPIHVASNFGAALDIIEILLEAFPGSTLVKTKKGSNAVKLAHKRGASADVIRILEDAYKKESATFQTDVDREKNSYSIAQPRIGFARGA